MSWIWFVALYLLAITVVMVAIFVGRTSADDEEIIPVSISVSESDRMFFGTELLFDTFTDSGSGSSNLDAHTPEVGGPWMSWNEQPQLQIQRDQSYVYAERPSWSSAPIDFTVNNDQMIVVTFKVPSSVEGLENPALFMVGWANRTTGNGVGFTFHWDPAIEEYTTSINNLNDFALTTSINPPDPISSPITFDTPLSFTATLNNGNHVLLDFEYGTQVSSGTSMFDSVSDNYDSIFMALSREGSETDHIQIIDISVDIQ